MKFTEEKLEKANTMVNGQLLMFNVGKIKGFDCLSLTINHLQL